MIDVLVSGKKYPYTLPVTNGAIAELLKSDLNRLFIAIPNIDKIERQTLSYGRVSAKLHFCPQTYGLMIIFSFTGEAILVFDCPFNAAIIPNVQMDNGDIEIIAVDSLTKEIVTIRYASMKDITLDLQKIVQYQLSDSFVAVDAERWINQQRAMYEPEDLAALPIKMYRLA
ncbi:hypothetical protein VCSRO91_2841 [Vibrio cholerae]|nr:hypothetical protein VCSRO91_2841 [Vibrio cholerae]